MSVGLDPSFGVGGQVVRAGSNGDDTQIMADAVAVQPDGKIVVAETRIGLEYSAVVERFDADGALDTTFGQGGTAVVYQPTGTLTVAKQILIQPDGKIVLAATATSILAFRLDADGTPDATFGTAGTFRDPTAGDTVTSLALQPDGKIVLAGTDAAKTSFLAERLDPGGTLDATFGSGGVANILPASESPPFTDYPSQASSVAIQADGKIVLAGETTFPGDPEHSGETAQVVRLDSLGQLDATFGTGGFGPVESQSYNDVTIRPDGKIDLVGSTINTSVLFGNTDLDRVTQLTSAGTLDPSYNGTIFNGLAVEEIGPGFVANPADPGRVTDALAIEPDGKVVTAGGTQPTVARLTIAGLPDPSFAPDGFSTLARDTRTDSDTSATPSLAIGPDGRIVVVTGGIETVPGGGETALGSFGFTITRFNYGEEPSDFFQTGATDPAVEIPSAAVIAVRPAAGGADQLTLFGIAGPGQTLPAPGDYDGSGRTEIGAYLPTFGDFAYRPAGGGPDVVTPFGVPGAGQTIPVPADYDGSGHAEIAAYLPAYGSFAYRPAGGGPDVVVPFGFAGIGQTIPAPADYFGTGRDDIAAYLPSIGAFAIRNPAGGPDEIIPFGLAGAGASIPVPGDYDGSGKAEVAVYMPSLAEFAYRPADGGPDVIVPFGAAGAGQTLPMPGDYDGSGRTEFAAYLPAFGIFAYRPSGGGPDVVEPFGIPGPGATIPFVTYPAEETGSVASPASERAAAASVEIPLPDDGSLRLEPGSSRKAKASG